MKKTTIFIGKAYLEDEDGREVTDHVKAHVSGSNVLFTTSDDVRMIELTYEEMRGIMGLMAAYLEKQGLYIKAKEAN